MKNNNGKQNDGNELVPLRGPPGEVSENRPYTVNLGRKRDWLDAVCGIAGESKPDGTFGEFFRACKQHPVKTGLEVAPILGLLAIGFVCAMDTYHWNFMKENRDALHALPFGIGDKVMEINRKTAIPAYRSRPGETAEETQRRRGCIDTLLLKDGDLYAQAMKSHPRAPLEFCENAVGSVPGKARDSLAK